jgi:hypothetical protein
MIRTILISTALLAVAGAAHAESVKVSLAGKTEAAVKIEISKASETVCRYAPVMEYSPCVQETYQDAMTKVARLKALRTASLTF